ncbi:hypothetical protein ACFYWH_35305 [Streptomyces sp. NPDC003737]|uniref:hypothetical protein n=1 Tax=Streptomyces sp. NPDC003737 TaxID=3364685 RepID=UPI00368862FF
MKIVAQVKLLPASAHVADALAATLRTCNRAANAASEVAFDRDLKRRNGLQEAVYHRIKADFDLGAQAAVRTIKKVCDAYATLKANLKAGNLGPEGGKRRMRAESRPVRFREGAAQPYDDRMLTWNLDERTVSIWAVAGRLKGMAFICSPEAMKLLASRKGESDLVMRDEMFFLTAIVDVPEPHRTSPPGSSVWTSASSASPPPRTAGSCPAARSTATASGNATCGPHCRRSGQICHTPVEEHPAAGIQVRHPAQPHHRQEARAHR